MLFAYGSSTQTAPGDTDRYMCSAQQSRFRPTRIVSTTRFVTGSIRETLGPPAFATQTAPGATAMPSGCGPLWMVAVTLFVSGSTREIVSSDEFDSHTAPSPAATASGVGTLILATTTFRVGSIRMSADWVPLIAQTAPSPTASGPPPLTGLIPRPTRIRATT